MDSAETDANRHLAAVPDEGRKLLRRRLTDQPISRRTFSCLLAAFLVAAPRLAITQGSTVVRRIGALDPGMPDTPENLRMFAEPLRELGWVEGQNLRVERRYANGGAEALKPLAEELVRAKVELIVTLGTPATIAAKRATTTIPIVFSAGDPVRFGLVASLARPGGNVTGFSLAGPEVDAKSLSLLKDLMPTLRRIGVLESSANPYFRATRGEFEQACRLLGLAPVVVEIAAAGEIVDAIAQLARQHVQVVLLGGGLLYDNRFQIVEAARKQGLPIMVTDAAPSLVQETGALVSYTVSLAEAIRRRAYFIDRILRGAKPADLPVEQPTRFELVINLKTARALKLAIPQSLLQRADEVIQ